MTGRAQELALRRRELVARSESQRNAVGATFGDIERRLGFVEVGLSLARRVHRHRALLGAFTIWSAVAPAAAKLWVRRLGWWIPLGLEGFRLAKTFAASRRETRTG
ncbi:MAG: hypothetical protein IPK64_14025 [bacterium]|nr:hypothetical protein [bacterium]